MADWLANTAWPNIKDVAGQALNVGEAINALASKDPQAFQRYMLSQQQALQDPATRAAVAQSPFFAGTLGRGLERTPLDPNDINYGLPDATAKQPLRGTLPPLTPTNAAVAALEQAKSNLIMGPDQQTIARVQLGLGVPFETVAANLQVLKALRGQDPDIVGTIDTKTGMITKLGYSHATAPRVGVSLPGEVLVPGPDGSVLSVNPSTGEQHVFLPRRSAAGQTQPLSPGERQLLGLPDPSTSPPPGTTAPPSPSLPPTPPPPTLSPSSTQSPPVVLPPGITPFQGANARPQQPSEGAVGYPPPAPTSGAPLPTAPGPSLAAPRSDLLPITERPGSRANIKIRPGLSITAPIGPPKLAATQVTEGMNIANINAAGQELLQLTTEGAPEAVTLMGTTFVPKGGQMTGPLTGPLLSIKARARDPFFGQIKNNPTYVRLTRMSQLTRQLFDIAFVFAGKRLTQTEINKMFQPLVPDLSEPNDIFQAKIQGILELAGRLTAERDKLLGISAQDPNYEPAVGFFNDIAAAQTRHLQATQNPGMSSQQRDFLSGSMPAGQ